MTIKHTRRLCLTTELRGDDIVASFNDTQLTRRIDPKLDALEDHMRVASALIAQLELGGEWVGYALDSERSVFVRLAAKGK